jgi:hypothetical protein
MRGKRPGLILLASGGMELTWLYAWATFLMTSTVHRPFPLPEALGTFVLAAGLTLLAQGRGWRVVLIIGLQVIGFLIAASRIIHLFYYRSYPFFGKSWLVEFLGAQRDHLEWLILVIILFFALMLWLGGVTLARRSTAYLTICTRFDLGVSALACLLLIKLLLLVKGGIEVQDPTSELLLFPFFVFSLLAIGMARNQSSAQRDFLAGYKGVGVLASFTVVVLAFSTALVLLFMPYLSAAAEAGYGVLKSAAGPLSPILVSVLRFLFFRSRLRHEPASSSPEGDGSEFIPSGESSWWGELAEKILGWGLVGLGVLVGLILCGLGTWYLVRWLFSSTPRSERGQFQWNLVLLWAQRLGAALLMVWHKLVRGLRGYRDAVQLYLALLRWGHRSGLPHLLSETPAEYGSRLSHRFPSLQKEIGGIVEAFNLVVYGEVVLDDEQMSLAKLSWHRLRSPLHWPSRLKAWFLQGR